MVYLSQLLRKDNFLTIEAIEEIISDKFDGFDYFKKKNLWGVQRKSTKGKKRGSELGKQLK